MVAVERYVCVCRAARYRSVCTVRRAAVVAVAVFVSMSLLAAPSAFRYRTRSLVVAVPVRDDDGANSSAPTTTRLANRTVYDVQPTSLGTDHRFVVVYFDWTLALVRSVIPLVVLTALNVRVVCAVWNRSSAMTTSRATPAGADRHDRRSSQNRNITAMLVLVVVVFAVCIVPDAVMSVVFGVGYVDEKNRTAKGCRELTDALMALSSAVNFVVYCLCSRRFRAVLVDTMYGGRRCSTFDDPEVNDDEDDDAAIALDGEQNKAGNGPCGRRRSRHHRQSPHR